MMVPTPKALLVMNNEIKQLNISGEEAPAAINVAPATSVGKLSSSHSIYSSWKCKIRRETSQEKLKTLREGTKKSSHTAAKAQNITTIPIIRTTNPPFFTQGSGSSISSSESSSSDAFMGMRAKANMKKR